MSQLREAAQQALEALEAMQSYAAAERKGLRICDESITALRAALTEPVCNCDMRTRLVGDGCEVCNPERAQDLAEPVAIVGTQEDVWKGYDGKWAPPGPPIKTVLMLRDLAVGTFLYTTPPQRKPLTSVELVQIELRLRIYYDYDTYDLSLHDFARAIERAHGIE